jgi:hypothetical protein
MNLEHIKTLFSRLRRKKQVVASEGGHWIYDLEFMFFSFEEWFTLNGHANGQNNTYWYYENTHVVQDFLLHNLKVTV